MKRNRSVSKWLAVGATSSALAFTLAFATPALPSAMSGDIVFAQGSGSGSGSGSDGGSGSSGSGAGSGSSNQQGSGSGGTGSGSGTGTQQNPGGGTGTGTGSSTQQGMGSGMQSGGMMTDPMRGGMEVPGQPACYMPAMNVTERKPYNLMRPSCYPGQM